jgi:hypothetical protein
MWLRYSSRKTVAGAIRPAHLAGSHADSKATVAMVTPAVASVNGSKGSTW